MRTIYIAFLCFLFSTIISIPSDQSTIQAGIGFALYADTVLVRPETYIENIKYNGNDITIGSICSYKARIKY